MIYGDYHTHTVYSHGKGNIDENACRAFDLGLKEIAITDHGFLHVAYNVRRMDWPFMVRDIRTAEAKYPGLRVLVGMETNLIDSKGRLDINFDDIAGMDVIVCGYHKFAHSSSLGEYFKFSAPIFFAGLLHKSSAKRMVANTDAFIRAMGRYPVDIISHPNSGLKVSFKELARAAAHYGTYLELNGKKISFSARDAEVMLAEGARFIMNSDAHSPDRVGEISKPLRFAEDAKIPFECIVNWQKVPAFKDKKGFVNPI